MLFTQFYSAIIISDWKSSIWIMAMNWIPDCYLSVIQIVNLIKYPVFRYPLYSDTHCIQIVDSEHLNNSQYRTCPLFRSHLYQYYCFMANSPFCEISFLLSLCVGVSPFKTFRAFFWSLCYDVRATLCRFFCFIKSQRTREEGNSSKPGKKLDYLTIIINMFTLAV